MYNAWNKIDTVLYVLKRNYDESLLRKAKGDNQSLPLKSEIVSPVLNRGTWRTVVGACLKEVVKKVVLYESFDGVSYGCFGKMNVWPLKVRDNGKLKRFVRK